MVGRLDGWMVKKFSSTLRIDVDPRLELREDKPRSARNERLFTQIQRSSRRNLPLFHFLSPHLALVFLLPNTVKYKLKESDEVHQSNLKM